MIKAAAKSARLRAQQRRSAALLCASAAAHMGSQPATERRSASVASRYSSVMLKDLRALRRG
jgi:hypothetical protein